MNPAQPDDKLPVSLQLQVDELCLQFESELQSAQQAKIEQFVNGVEPRLRPTLLKELLLLEFESQAQHGEPIELSEFVNRFPADEALVHSAYSEHVARSQSRILETEAHARNESLHRDVGQGDSAPSAAGLSDSSHHGRFLPGTIVADRYRIVAMLGKGGMGEVYRADDLKLGQTVALKFLPSQLAQDEKRLKYFREEVRLTRQISHPNVCRVYDIGEVDGQYFLSMEYIDGEDLKILLRRIGRMPKDKGVQIAQQLCAGLAAAHEKGVLHRDLKPANIMIDGRGQVRITDFGLAKLTDDRQEDEIVGTPAYMAPEQLRNGQSTVRSDVYSLGLILYEVFTGEAVNKSHSIQDLLQAQEDSALSKPSGLVEDMDPVVERVILRCLEREAHDRPSSVLAVQAALPGGDILAAALAAGETPSPEMLVAAGDSRLINTRLALCLLLLVLGSVPCGLALRRVFHKDDTSLNLPLEPAVLRQRCRDYLKELGYESPFKDSISGFVALTLNRDGTDINAASLDDPLTAIRFWYRASQDVIRPIHKMIALEPANEWNPPRATGEQAGMRLDPNGRLMEFWAVRQTHIGTGSARKRLDDGQWQKLISLVADDAKLVESSLFDASPPVPVDECRAWTGSMPNGSPIQVEAGGYQGQIVWAKINHLPDNQAWIDPMEPRQPEDVDHIQSVFLALFYAILAIVGSIAWQNTKKGRTNQPGAIRIAILASVLHQLFWLFSISRITEVHEGIHSEFFLTLGASLVHGALVAIVYLALEPYVRRWWPEALVGWTRLLSKGLNDPIVGRDILIGLATAAVLYSVLMGVVPNAITAQPITTLSMDLGIAALQILLGSAASFLYVFVVVATKASTGVRWPAFVFLWLLSTSLFWWSRSVDFLGVALVIATIIYTGVLLVFSRWGALPIAVAIAVLGTLSEFAERPNVAWTICFVLALFAFHRSLGGRAIFETRTKTPILDGSAVS